MSYGEHNERETRKVKTARFGRAVWVLLCCLVEAGGIEPPSVSRPHAVLHA